MINIYCFRRNHNSIDIENAIKKIKNAYSNFNIDLMYGFSNQTSSQLNHDIEIIKKLKPPIFLVIN